MSFSSYSQGLQSCLEQTRILEPRVLRLKLAPSKSKNYVSSTALNPSVAPDSDCNSESDKNVDMGGWSFLQSLAKTTKETTENDKIYIPPNVKRSSSLLSEKSLEMCTESLGSETGSDGSESSEEMGLFSPENVNYQTRERSKLKGTSRMKKQSTSFPPPLTSISGSTSVHVRSHREGGRLVMEAVSISTCRAYFHAERINGRLRLHLMKDCSPKCDKKEQEEGEEAAAAYEEKLIAEDELLESHEGDIEAADGEADDIRSREELEGNSGNVGGEMGMGHLPRAGGRCMDGGSEKNGFNWEPFCVAT